MLLKTLQLWFIKTMIFYESPALSAASTNHAFFETQMLQSGTHYNAITFVSFFLTSFTCMYFLYNFYNK